MRLNLITPPAIIAPAPAVKKSTLQENERIEFVEKLQRQLFTGKILQRGKDGRTYNYIDKDGNYVSSFLSPYNKDILDNVEPEIKELISVLINKGYLTAGSCQGHPRDPIEKTFFRWVNIAFISDEERSKFIKTVDSYKLPVYWYFNFLDFENNPKKDEIRDGITMTVNMKDKVLKNIEDQKNEKYTNDDLTNYWNIMFSRNYKEYYPVMMCICSLPGDITFFDKVSTFVTWPFRNFYTKKLVEKIKTIENYGW